MRIAKALLNKVALLLMGILLVSGCGKSDKQMVARVGGRKITINDFEKKFGEGRRTKDVQNATLDEKKKFLEKMIDTKLKLISAYQNDLNKDENVARLINERKKTLLFRRLVEKEVMEKIIPESRIKNYYKRASKEVKISQIVLKNTDNSAEQKKQNLIRARKIVRRIKSGEKFSDLAKEVSNDLSTAKDGGQKGYLKWGVTSYKNPVYVAAFSMKNGEVSDPIEVENGVYIIKVIHVKKYPSPPYEQEREKIKQSIYRKHNKEIEQAYYEFLDALKVKYKLEYDNKAISFFVKTLESKNKAKASDGDAQQPKSMSDNFDKKDLKRALAELSFKKLSIGDVIEHVEKFPRHRRPKFHSEEELKVFLKSRVIPTIILQKEIERKNIENDKVVIEQMKSYEEKVLERTIYKQQVSDMVKLTDEEIKAFFEENRDSYKHPPMREVHEIYVSDKELADKIVSRARSGESYSRLFERYNEKKTLSKNKGKLGFISAGRAGIGKPAFKVKVGEIAGPIRIGNGYSIIKVISEKPSELKTFEEAENVVISRLRRKKISEREKQWLDEIRDRTKIVIYEKNLEEAGKNYIGKDVILVD